MKQVIRILFCLVLGAGNCYATTPAPDPSFSDRVNLALRQVGHQLLQLACDERSTVPPVQLTGADEFTLQLAQPFNYDTLPQLLSEAFLSFNIQRDYLVGVRRCVDNTLILGYNLAAFKRGEVACGGREQVAECSNIVLTFVAPASPPAHLPASSMLRLFVPLLVLVALVLAGLGWRGKRRPTTGAAPAADTLPLGHFSFDYQNQILELDNQQQTLTFRENKLLHYLVRHANQVIPRDTLIAAVWGDEGVIVGRSLDVFVSRLRKRLLADPAVGIKSIHGVGYRLEVSS
ncbi:MAG: transcriptional regulator [Bacteroidetes bacterium]|nr:MAG: transcriptional regulator [Bacteroidota bacterium]PTM10592.1 MAG: transcriptional regulator [Bacteroidota bacterium]